jgi:hypothetical protein
MRAPMKFRRAGGQRNGSVSGPVRVRREAGAQVRQINPTGEIPLSLSGKSVI